MTTQYLTTGFNGIDTMWCSCKHPSMAANAKHTCMQDAFELPKAAKVAAWKTSKAQAPLKLLA